MYVNVTLYKTKLSTTDTMVFSTKEEQTEFFNGLTKLDLGQCSFNGKRTIRITGNYFMLNIGGYNYIKIYYTDGSGNERTYYAFIDLFRYVNDNCCEVDVTTDYIQTYMFDIQFSQLFVEQRNYSLNDEILSTLQYKNNYPVSRLDNILTHKISKTYLDHVTNEECSLIFVCILVNTDGETTSFLKDSYIHIPFINRNESSDIDTTHDIACIIIPRGVSSKRDGIYKNLFYYKYQNQIHSITNDVEVVLSRFSGLILDVFTVDTIIDGVDISIHYNESGLDDGMLIEFDDVNFEVSTASTDAPVLRSMYSADEHIIEYTPNYKSLFRAPYYNIYVGRNGRTMSLLNPFEIDGDTIKYKVYTDFIPIYSTYLKINTKRKYDNIYSIDGVIEGFVYSTNKWDEYKLSHSASVGDSLATKHAYDMEIAERNYNNAKNIAASKYGAIGAQAAGNLIGGIAGGVGSLLGGNVAKGATQLIGGVGRAAGNLAAGAITYEQELENASVAYENTLTTIEQESALLEIEYNNIKNAPNAINNLYSASSYLYETTSFINFNYLQASNIDEIIKYHKRFGFETALQTEITDLDGLHDTNAQDFDYIRTLNCNVISENIPKTSADMIAKIFNSGIYLWRNYEKLGEDYLSNYEGE